MKKYIVAFLLLIFPIVAQSATVIDYGFEDWSGYSGELSPANSYIYSMDTITPAGWTEHTESTIVTQGGVSCDDNTAYEGLYYQHTQTCTNVVDPCLGRAATTSNVRNYIGINGLYPTGVKNTTDLGTIMTGSTAIIRFQFRCTGDWTSLENDVADGGGGLKFIRWAIGANVIGDDNNILIKARYDYGEPLPRIGIFDRADNSVTYGTMTVDWQDGNWHAFAVKSVRTGDGLYSVSAYIDDWDMITPFVTRATTVPVYGDGYYHWVSLVANWSGVTSTPNLIGIDFDNVEILDSDSSPSLSTTVTLDPSFSTVESPTSYTGTATTTDGVFNAGSIVSSNGYVVTITSGLGTSSVTFTVTGVIPTVTDTITATASGGSSDQDSITISLLSLSTVTNQTSGTTVTSPSFQITGTATATTGKTIASVTCAGQTVIIDDGIADELEETFTINLILSEGLNTFTIVTTDSEGDTDSVVFNVTYNATPVVGSEKASISHTGTKTQMSTTGTKTKITN